MSCSVSSRHSSVTQQAERWPLPYGVLDAEPAVTDFFLHATTFPKLCC